jgi:hypothetical protein
MNHAALADHFGPRRIFISSENITTANALVSQLVATLIDRDSTTPLPINQNLNIVMEALASRLARQSPTLLCLDNFETVFDNDESKASDLLRALLKCRTVALTYNESPCPLSPTSMVS